jgi:hypothetical protein
MWPRAGLLGAKKNANPHPCSSSGWRQRWLRGAGGGGGAREAGGRGAAGGGRAAAVGGRAGGRRRRTVGETREVDDGGVVEVVEVRVVVALRAGRARGGEREEREREEGLAAVGERHRGWRRVSAARGGFRARRRSAKGSGLGRLSERAARCGATGPRGDDEGFRRDQRVLLWADGVTQGVARPRLRFGDRRGRW